MEKIITKYKKRKLNENDYQEILDNLSDFSDFNSESESSDTDDESDISDLDMNNNSRETEDKSEPSCSQDNNTWNNNNEMPNIENFIGNSGIKVHIPETPLGFLQLFITRELLEHFKTETNRYADKRRQNKEGHFKRWHKASVADIAKYIGLTILFGIFKLPRLPMYWAKNAEYFSPIVSNCMSYGRYMLLNGFFHSNASDSDNQDNQDRLSKLRPVIDYFLRLFNLTYIPTQNLSIDEGMLAFKGRLVFKCYSPMKPIKYGIKLYILAESDTGFVSNFQIYSGTGSTTSEIVTGLLDNFKNKNYHVYMDNFYNSVQLSEKLLQDKIYTCGTLRVVRGAPKNFQNSLINLKKGDVTFCRKGDVFVIAWKDKKIVSMVTTNNNASTRAVTRNKKSKKNGKRNFQQETVDKPLAIIDYNKNMKGVDFFDQMTKYYSFARRSCRWSKKVTFYLLQMAIYNAYALYKQYTTDKKPMDLLSFHIMTYRALINFKLEEWPVSGHNVDENDPYREMNENSQEIVPTNNFIDHESDFVPHIDITFNKSKIIFSDPLIRRDKSKPHILELMPDKKRKSCRVCSKTKTIYNSRTLRKNTKTTRYECLTCNIPLCLGACYSMYHTYHDYAAKAKTYQMTKSLA